MSFFSKQAFIKDEGCDDGPDNDDPYACGTNWDIPHVVWPPVASSKKRKLDSEFIVDNNPPSKKQKICHVDPLNTTVNSNDKLLSILKSRFGFSSFRNQQRFAITSCLNGRDVVLLMPTGYGKSICFQIIPLITNKIGIVISPLIALMKNHVDYLVSNNINAVLFNSSVSMKDKESILQSLRNKIKKLQKQRRENIQNQDNDDEVEIFYTTPETLNSNLPLKSILKSLNFLKGISIFAIDESHCISSWGHDFRPKYRLLNQIRNNYPTVPIMAVTATATYKVQNDIIHSLKLNNPHVIVGNFDRRNLYFSFKYTQQIKHKQPFDWRKFVKNKKNKKNKNKVSPGYIKQTNDEKISRENRIFADDVTQYISKNYSNSCGIIYVFSRKDAEQIASYLQQNSDLSIEAYHAGFNSAKRSGIQQRWESDQVKIICSTNAFGMGIDKTNVRFVIHNVITKNMESYYQQIGRAGRDGKHSNIICYYNSKMIKKIQRFLFQDSLMFIKNANPDRDWKRGELSQNVRNSALYKHKIEQLESIKMFAEAKQCRRKYILQYFGSDVSQINRNNKDYKCCDYCDDPQSINAVVSQYNQRRQKAANKKRYGKLQGALRRRATHNKSS